MQSGAFGKALSKESLLHAGLAEPLRGIHRITPENADDVIGVERRFHVSGIGFAGGDGIRGRLPTADVLVAVLEPNREVAEKNRLAGELVDLVEFLLRELAPERRLDRDTVDVGQHLLQNFGNEGIEGEAVAEDEVVGVIFTLGSADDAEVFAGDEAQKGQVAAVVIVAFPGAQELPVSLLAWGALRQTADEVDPVLPGGILEWP